MIQRQFANPEGRSGIPALRTGHSASIDVDMPTTGPFRLWCGCGGGQRVFGVEDLRVPSAGSVAWEASAGRLGSGHAEPGQAAPQSARARCLGTSTREPTALRICRVVLPCGRAEPTPKLSRAECQIGRTVYEGRRPLAEEGKSLLRSQFIDGSERDPRCVHPSVY